MIMMIHAILVMPFAFCGKPQGVALYADSFQDDELG